MKSNYTSAVDSNSSQFKDWLISENTLKTNSARDVISMKNQLSRLVPNSSSLSLAEIENQLKIYYENDNLKIQTLKRMLRAEKLFRKYLDSLHI